MHQVRVFLCVSARAHASVLPCVCACACVIVYVKKEIMFMYCILHHLRIYPPPPLSSTTLENLRRTGLALSLQVCEPSQDVPSRVQAILTTLGCACLVMDCGYSRVARLWREAVRRSSDTDMPMVGHVFSLSPSLSFFLSLSLTQTH